MNRLAPLLIVVLVLAAGAMPVWADFAAGMAAYDRGDYQTAYKEWLPLAEAGDIEAGYRIGLLYKDGLGIDRDVKKARKWLYKAGNQAPPALKRDAGKALDEIGGAIATAQATWLIREASHEGDPEAMYLEGKANEVGPELKGYNFDTFIRKNPARAALLYRKAAEKGYASAQVRLGWLYYKGIGVAQNEVEALEWTLKGAKQGDLIGKINLSLYFKKGAFIQSNVFSLMWYFVVAGDTTQEGKIGKALLQQEADELLRTMPANEIQQARTLAQPWIEKHR